MDLNPQLKGCLCRWEEFCSISRPSYLGTSCTCGDSLGPGLASLSPGRPGEGIHWGVAPAFQGVGVVSSLLATSPLMCPCSSGGRRSRAPQGGGEERAGPDREFEKRKEVGPAECLATPWLLPRGTTPGAHRPPAQPWLPGAKLTRSGKAWVGAGVGSAAGSRAGGRRPARWKMLRSPRLRGLQGACTQGPGRAQWLPPPAAGPAGRGRGGRGRERWAPSPPGSAQPVPAPGPSRLRLPSLLNAYAFPRWRPVQRLATPLSVPGSGLQGCPVGKLVFVGGALLSSLGCACLCPKDIQLPASLAGSPWVR